MKKKNKAVWGTRFNNATSKIFEQIGASIDVPIFSKIFDVALLNLEPQTALFFFFMC